MCFEFEALYWAKLAEEEERKRLARQEKAAPEPELQPEPGNVDGDAVPA